MIIRRILFAALLGSLVLLPYVSASEADAAADDEGIVIDEEIEVSDREMVGNALSLDKDSLVPVDDVKGGGSNTGGGVVTPSPSPSSSPVLSEDFEENLFETLGEMDGKEKVRDETMNNNLAILAGCIMACGGMLIGYWTGSDLLSIWHK